MAVSKLPPAPEILKLVGQGVTRVQIARRYGVSPAAVYNRLEKHDATRGQVSADAQSDAEGLSNGQAALCLPGLTLSRAVALVRCDGRYRDMDALAKDWGVPSRRVHAWWHRLRVAS